MMRTLWLGAAMVVMMRAPASDASCAATPVQTAKIVVDKCTAVDTSTLKSPAKPASYAGVLLEGTVTAGKDKPQVMKVWIPASEKLACTQIKVGATVSGTLGFACCDGDPNPPCYIDTAATLTKVKVDATVAAPKPVKQMTRPELETEVEALRADNARLRADFDRLVAEEKARVEKLQKQLGTKLK